MITTIIPAKIHSLLNHSLFKEINNDIGEQLISFDAETIKKNQVLPVFMNKMGAGTDLIFAQFGLNPAWAKTSVSYPNLTAPLEAVSGIKTYRKPYRKSQFCAVPMLGFCIEDEQSGQAFKITRQDKQPFFAPALYEYNEQFEEPLHSVALLTKQSDENTLRFPQPVKLALPLVLETADINLFLVANWKFNKGYYHKITPSDFVMEDFKPTS